jgi:hypothetical protein
MSFSKPMIRKSPWQRNTLICKPEQSGKTFVMLEKIMERLKEPDDGRETVNFILCDNNLLLTEQTSYRVEKDLSQILGGKHFVEFSSHKRTEYHSLSHILEAITKDGARNIISCTNRQRINDIEGIINVLNMIDKYSRTFQYRIWLDEADKFIKGMDDTFGPLLYKYENIEMFCITATPSRLFEAYGYMNTLAIENPISENYHGWEDNHIHIHEPSQRFIHEILSGPALSKLQPGTKWFIPGLVEKDTHHSVKNICVSYGMAVAVVNGDGISLKIPRESDISLDSHEGESFLEVDFILSKDDVFNTKIKQIYESYDLCKYPFVITGYNCIQRGITISSHDFLLDFAIITGFTDISSASQIAGRLKGNQKSWETYKPCEVYTTQQFNDIVVDYEQKSRSLGSYVFHKEMVGNGTLVFKEEWDNCHLPKQMKRFNDKSRRFYEWKIKKIDRFLRSIMCQ